MEVTLDVPITPEELTPEELMEEFHYADVRAACHRWLMERDVAYREEHQLWKKRHAGRAARREKEELP